MPNVPAPVGAASSPSSAGPAPFTVSSASPHLSAALTAELFELVAVYRAEPGPVDDLAVHDRWLADLAMAVAKLTITVEALTRAAEVASDGAGR